MTNLNVAVIGCGYWGKNLVRNFHALNALAMVCDGTASGRKTAADLAPGVPVVSSLDDVLACAAVTAVVFATPAETHHALAKRALLSGRDVYVEKPLCLSDTEGRELVDTAAAQDRILMVGHLLQYHPCVTAMQEMVASGRLGKLFYITSNRLNLGKIRQEENALWSFAPHDLSVILSLTGDRLPETVTSSGGAYLQDGICDTTLTAMTFANGVRAHVYVSWLNPFKEQKLTVVGSLGMAVFDDTKPWAEKLLFYGHYLTWDKGALPVPSKAKGEAVIPTEEEPLRKECQHFLECCQTRFKPKTDGAEGLRVLQTLNMAQRSLDQNGVPVRPCVLSDAQPDYFVHFSAFADEGAVIGKGTKIWHFSHIQKGAKIGERCVIGQNVNIDGGTVIGNNVKIQNNVSVYTGLVIEDDAFLGPSCVLTNVTNPRSQVNRHSLYERTVIRRGATLGANCTIICGVEIGRYALIGAGAVVPKNVPDYALMVGNPARQKGWMSRHGHLLKNPDAKGVMVCPESGLRYREVEKDVLKCLDLDEEAPLPQELTKGVKTYDEFKVK
jgi:UDP-2-acetamido-3-amino-2,3-dideoxy-glucuronate N-acetyltransferase